MIRSRTCTQPKPSLKGRHCEGSPVQVAYCNRYTCPDTRVFFTAIGVTGVTGSSIAKYSNIIQSYGNEYDTNTGNFTCKYPGIYMFSFQISKQWWSHQPDFLECYICVNGVYRVGARSDPHGDDKDGYSISVTGTFHLKINDIVNVGACAALFAAHNDARSSFTGVLIVPDKI
ncbi:complement C1q-like protein 2 [Ruditapes philippinarum]|uniref:complement C1q-like protein 2 n=1 Tax=Ruditapes philippinarum TaxID=129788 RepID=UPI00295B43D5|nr:complement C1q-like protein 2 [Ruditapes philippinarum]